MRRAGYLLAWFPLHLCALDPGTQLHHYSHRFWSVRDGLPRNTITALAQTSDGYLWVGTDEGVARFDGVRFQVFDARNTAQLPVPVVTALAAARDGSLWIGTRGGGLLRHRDGRFERFTRNQGLPDNLVRAILEDRAGRLWIGTQQGIVFRDGGVFRPFAGNPLLPSRVVLALHQDRAGGVWAATSGGVARIEGDLVDAFPMRTGRDSLPVRAIEQDDHGVMWAGTEGCGLYRYDGRAFRPAPGGPGAGRDVIRALRCDRDGNLWTGGSIGGLRRRGSGAPPHSAIEGLTDAIVRCLLEDSEANLWVGTEGAGLHRLSDPRIITYTTRDGLSHNFTRAVLEDRKGNVWIGTEGGGLNRYRNGKFTAYRSRDGLGSDTVTALLEDRQGTIWIAAEDGGISRFANGALRKADIPGLGATQTVWSLAEGLDGSVWLATSGGLRQVRDGRAVSFMELPWEHPRALRVTRRGDLWIGFREGALAVYREGVLTRYHRQPGMLAAAISSIQEDRGGRVWITTAAGLMLFRDGGFVSFTQQQGLFHDRLFEVLDDGAGNLWLTSSRGIFTAPAAHFLEVAEGRRKAVECSLFTTADGLRTEECTGDSQPAAWRARDGSLWFPTVQGVAVLNSQRYEPREMSITVRLEEVLADGRKLDLDRLAELPPGAKEILFRYSAPHFLAPEKLRFEYRLEGSGLEWRDAGVSREVALPVPGPGNYRFLVRPAGGHGGGESATPSFSFSVAPYFYQTGWFYAILVAACGVVAFLLYRAHLREVRARFNAVLAERSRVAREIHDTLLQGFTGAALEIDAITKTMVEAPRQAQDRLAAVLETLDGCLSEARHSIVELRHRPLEARDLPSAVAALTQKLAAGAKAEVRFELFGRSRPVPEAVEQNLLAVLREALSNSLRHSAATLVQVELSFTAHEVLLRVRDNGRGLPPREPAGHFGLVGIEERAVAVGGRVSIRSGNGSGAEVSLTVPLPENRGRGRRARAD